MLQFLKKFIGSFFSPRQVCETCGNFICKNDNDYYGDKICKCGDGGNCLYDRRGNTSSLQVVGADLESYDGTGQFDLPVPASFVVDQDGKIVFAHVDADYTKWAEPGEVLEAVKSLGI